MTTRKVQPDGMSRAGYPAPGAIYHWARWSITASAAVFDARAAVDNQVGKQRAPVVLLGLEGECHAWVTPEAGSTLRVEERREDDLVAVEAGPAQVNVGLAVTVHRHDVRP